MNIAAGILESSYAHVNIINEPSHEKTNNLGFLTRPIQTRIYSHHSKLKA